MIVRSSHLAVESICWGVDFGTTKTLLLGAYFEIRYSVIIHINNVSIKFVSMMGRSEDDEER